MNYPTHDPDVEDRLYDISDSTLSKDKSCSLSSEPLFRPYPNMNVFLLAEWYWSGGTQKTKESFKNLIRIISDQSFNPADVKGVSWDFLNDCLGSSDCEGLWFDEPDAGWTQTSITLPIPFHRNTPQPGLCQYTFPPFRHRSIVSVLKEKMANPHDFKHFI